MTSKKVFVVAVVLALFCSIAAYGDAVPTFTVSLTQPNISGAPGETVGWGFTITNNSDTYTLAPFNVGNDSFQHGDGVAMFDIFNYIDPRAQATVDFDWTNFTGLFAFTWEAGAPVGFTNSGQFEIDANFLDANSNLLTDANGNPITFTQYVDYSVTVSAPQTLPAVPEPASMVLLASGLVGLSAFTRRKANVYCCYVRNGGDSGSDETSKIVG